MVHDFLNINSMFEWNSGVKIVLNYYYFNYCRLIARANRTRKSRYNILPPTGTRAKYISKLIKHNALPFIGNFCANSGVGSSPSDNDKLISHCHTWARVQSRGSERERIEQLFMDSSQEQVISRSRHRTLRILTDWQSIRRSFHFESHLPWILYFVPSLFCFAWTHTNVR